MWNAGSVGQDQPSGPWLFLFDALFIKDPQSFAAVAVVRVVKILQRVLRITQNMLLPSIFVWSIEPKDVCCLRSLLKQRSMLRMALRTINPLPQVTHWTVADSTSSSAPTSPSSSELKSTVDCYCVQFLIEKKSIDLNVDFKIRIFYFLVNFKE